MNTSIAILAVMLPFIGGLIMWCLNERSKRKDEEYKRKQDRYLELIKNLRGFYVGSSDKQLRDAFLDQVSLCWMYCPDEVVHKAYNFLSMVHTDGIHSDDEKEKAVGEFILAMRNDLIKRNPLTKTTLKPEDFKHLKAT